MPIFDYACASCHMKFDVYHRGKEDSSKVKCPACGSVEFRKLVSVPANVGGGKGMPMDSHCETGKAMGGCCGGGMCGLN